jgi:hypothetical protein
VDCGRETDDSAVNCIEIIYLNSNDELGSKLGIY